MKKIINSIRKFFTPVKWTTVWTKPINGWSSDICGNVQRNVPMVLKLQTTETKFRFVLSDGTCAQHMDTDYILARISGTREALVANGCRCA